MQSIRVVWLCLEYLPIDGFRLRQTPGLMVFQRGPDGLGDRRIHGVRACRLNFPKRPATLLVPLAAATGTWIVTTDFFHNCLLSHLFITCRNYGPRQPPLRGQEVDSIIVAFYLEDIDFTCRKSDHGNFGAQAERIPMTMYCARSPALFCKCENSRRRECNRSEE